MIDFNNTYETVTESFETIIKRNAIKDNIKCQMGKQVKLNHNVITNEIKNDYYEKYNGSYEIVDIGWDFARNTYFIGVQLNSEMINFNEQHLILQN